MASARVDFALTRFEAIDGARLEVEGTWSGVRGVRFVRPALVVRDGGSETTLLADLEHKPWPAREGETWVAAFPWTGGEPDVARTQLAVAPSIVVPLGAAAADGAPTAVDPLDALRARAEEAEERARRMDAEVAFLRREREERASAAAERDARRAEVEALRRERDQARTARDAAVAERDEARTARDAAIAERDALAHEREEVRGELRRREQIAEGAAGRREQAVQERDAARRGLA
ncbi:MAG TPA: hypothetical protein VNT03_07010, partial [Baekduia sp.]|nr:hypothetical protein [Baekduia sp.]